MDNPEKPTTPGTQDTGRRQTTQKHNTEKTKTMSNTDITKTQEPAKGKQFPPLTSHSQYVLDSATQIT